MEVVVGNGEKEIAYTEVIDKIGEGSKQGALEAMRWDSSLKVAECEGRYFTWNSLQEVECGSRHAATSSHCYSYMLSTSLPKFLSLKHQY